MGQAIGVQSGTQGPVNVGGLGLVKKKLMFCAESNMLTTNSHNSHMGKYS